MIRLAPAVVGYPDDVLSRAERFGASLVVPTVLPGTIARCGDGFQRCSRPVFFRPLAFPRTRFPGRSPGRRSARRAVSQGAVSQGAVSQGVVPILFLISSST